MKNNSKKRYCFSYNTSCNHSSLYKQYKPTITMMTPLDITSESVNGFILLTSSLEKLPSTIIH